MERSLQVTYNLTIKEMDQLKQVGGYTYTLI